MGITPHTVVFCGTPYTGDLSSGVGQAITMPTIVLPEASKTFESVTLFVWWTDGSATAVNTTGRRVDVGLNGGSKTAYTNTQTVTQTGENIAQGFDVDLTAQFVSQWSGTSMTFELDVTITRASAVTQRNVCTMLVITYQRDDASATQVKTVFMPLNAPVGSLGTSKPSSLATIPALDTELPEAGKTILGTWVDLEWAMGTTSGTIDQVVSMEVGSNGVHTTGAVEMALASAMAIRYVWPASFSTASSQTWHLWTTSSSYIFHPQARLVVTYTYDASATTHAYLCAMVPLKDFLAPLANSASHVTRGLATLLVGEDSPTTKAVAAYVWWASTGALAGLNFRLGFGSYVTYTDGGSVFAGSNCLMVRNDAAFTLSKGANTLNADGYTSTGATNSGQLGGYVLVCWTAAIPAAGIGALTRTIFRALRDSHAANAGLPTTTTQTVGGTGVAVAPLPTMPSRFILSAIGLGNYLLSIGGVAAFQTAVQISPGWRNISCDVCCSDAETGMNTIITDVSAFWKRWPDDERDGFVPTAAVRWKWSVGTINAAAQAAAVSSFIFATFHGRTYAIEGEIKGAGSGFVNISLYRASSGEKLLSTSRSGDGAFSFDWYDDQDVFVVARSVANPLRCATSPPFSPGGAPVKLRLVAPKTLDAVVLRKAGG